MFCYFPLLQKKDFIGDVLKYRKIMAGKNYNCATLSFFCNNCFHQRDPAAIQRVGGFIENENIRLFHDSSCYTESLLHSQRELFIFSFIQRI